MSSRWQEWLSTLILLLATLSFFVPWAWHSDAALSPAARELAEWTTLLPQIRSGAPALFPSFLLRASLTMLAVLWGTHAHFTASKWGRLWRQFAALLLALLLLPPPDFLSSAQADPNYQQQFVLSLSAIIAISLLVIFDRKLPRAAAYGIGVSGAVLAALLGGAGLAAGIDSLNSLKVAIVPGPGGLLFISFVVILAAVEGFSWHAGTRIQA